MSLEKWKWRAGTTWWCLITLIGALLMRLIPLTALIEYPQILDQWIQLRQMLGVALFIAAYGFAVNLLALFHWNLDDPRVAATLGASMLGVALGLVLGHEIERSLAVGCVLTGGILACAIIAQWGKSPPDRLE